MRFLLWAFVPLALALAAQSAHLQPSAPNSMGAEATLRELSDAEYPDNPYLESRHTSYGAIRYHRIVMRPRAGNYDLILVPENEHGDTIEIDNINLGEFIPSAPLSLRKDTFLTHLSLVSQELNRVQVQFTDIKSSRRSSEHAAIARVDIANNCLSAGLWEVMLFSSAQDSLETLVYHGWFNFPGNLYRHLFEMRNGLPYSALVNPLKKWQNLSARSVNLSLLRDVVLEKAIGFSERNKGMFPPSKEQKRKKKLILFPSDAHQMDDFLTDKTQFAAFVEPGIYKKAMPRLTELGRFSHLKSATGRKTISRVTDSLHCVEIELVFADADNKRETRFVVGGIESTRVPVLSEAQFSAAWANAMGVGNYPAMIPYQNMMSLPSAKNPYFALLLDAQGNWLDNRKVGTDGPILHWDRNGLLHLWMTSFERTTIVGHYVFDLSGLGI